MEGRINKKDNKKEQKTLLLLDMHGLIHRAYHALPKFRSPKGEPTGALYGLSTMLLRAIREINPDYVVAAYDLPGPTFRHAAYENYKVKRTKADDELISQLSRAHDITKAFGIPELSLPGFEADDVLGAIVEQTKKTPNLNTIIVSGDSDVFQLVENDRVVVYTMRKGIEDTVLYNEEKIADRFGFSPKLLPAYKGLRGDASDNIVGVPGVGEKTATEIIKYFGSLENLYKQITKKDFRAPSFLKPRVIELLKKHREDAFFSQELGTIRKDAPVKFSFLDEPFSLNADSIRTIFQTLGFASLVRRLDERQNGASDLPKKSGAPNVTTPAVQGIFSGSNQMGEFWEEIAAPGVLALAKNDDMFLARGKNRLWYFDKTFFEQQREMWVGLVSKKEIIFFEGKRIIKEFLEANIPVPQRFFDCGVAGWVCDSALKGPSLKELWSYFCNEQQDDNALIFLQIERLAGAIEKQLVEKNLSEIWTRLEMPLMAVLAEMEWRGIGVDKKELTTTKLSLAKELRSLEEKIFKLAGASFNIASPAQVGEVIFSHLGVTTKKIKKTSTGKISTRESELVKLKDAHPVVALILEHREISKLISTYVEPLALLSDNEGRVHTTFSQTGTVTGRLSSESPNLQNIPVRSARGAKIRNAFVSASGYTLVAFDYVQIELKILAHLAGDEKMISAFKNGVDIHRLTASEINNVALGDVTPAMRSAAKAINFGIVFGMGVRQLAASTNMSPSEAERFYNEYFRDFPNIRAYIDNVRADAKKNGFVATLYGRKRFFDINAIRGNRFLEAEMERMAVNAVVQGTDADIVKKAMILVYNKCNRQHVRALLQIHDEMVYEISDTMLDTAISQVREIMENSASLAMPLTVGVSVGKRWGELKKWG